MREQRLHAKRQMKRQSFLGGLLLGILLGAGLTYGSLRLGELRADRQAEEQSQQSEADTADEASGTEQETGNSTPESTEVEKMTYIVQAGDSLSKIASKYETTQQAIMLLNDLDDPNLIYEGQELIVRDKLPEFYFGKVENNVMHLMKNQIDGSGETLLMSAKVFDSDPRIDLSYDRSKVLFTESSLSGGLGAQTFIANVDGTDRKQIISDELNLPTRMGQTWARGDMDIAFASGNNIWYYDQSAAEQILISDSFVSVDEHEITDFFSWHPSGNSLACVLDIDSQQVIATYNLSSRALVTVLVLTDMTVKEIIWPETYFIYFIGSSGSGSEIYKVQSQTGSLAQVTDNSLDEASFAFGRDASSFTFAVTEIDSAEREAEKGIWYMDQSGQLRQLYSTAYPARVVGFNRSGSEIYFQQQVESRDEYYAVDIESQRLQILLRGSGLYFFGD